MRSEAKEKKGDREHDWRSREPECWATSMSECAVNESVRENVSTRGREEEDEREPRSPTTWKRRWGEDETTTANGAGGGRSDENEREHTTRRDDDRRRTPAAHQSSADSHWSLCALSVFIFHIVSVFFVVFTVLLWIDLGARPSSHSHHTHTAALTDDTGWGPVRWADGGGGRPPRSAAPPLSSLPSARPFPVHLLCRPSLPHFTACHFTSLLCAARVASTRIASPPHAAVATCHPLPLSSPSPSSTPSPTFTFIAPARLGLLSGLARHLGRDRARASAPRVAFRALP